MPTYSAICNKCKTTKDYFSRIIDRENTPECCNQKMDRALTVAMVPQVGIADGSVDRVKEMARKGLRPLSDLSGEAEHQANVVKKEIDAKRRQVITDIVTSH